MSVTPMMQQYLDAKAACGDAVLLFRMGDFYEVFGDDAKTCAREIGLTLTSREKGDNALPMAGFPHHQLEGYLGKLINSGFRVAVCDQVEDPKQAKGLVKREITRVVTAGTLTDDALLDPRQSNYLAAVAPGPEEKDGAKIGLAWAELSTGRFYACVFPRAELADQLARIEPSECIFKEGGESPPTHLAESFQVTRRPAWAYNASQTHQTLTRHFGAASLEGFGFEDDDAPAICAAGVILDYLSETQKASLDHIDRLIPYRSGDTLEIDESSRRSLELTHTIRDGKREGSLLAVLDRTVTAMGSRLLADWLANPLTSIERINDRLSAVEELTGSPSLITELRTLLKGVYDLERLLARISTGRGSPRDLRSVGQTLAQLPKVKAKMTGRSSETLARLERELDLCPDLRTRLDAALNDDCPIASREGGIIRSGFDDELDRLRELAAGGKEWIARYQKEEAEKTGIPNLKIGFNKVFGYYLELTNAHKDKAPDYFHRKQTLKNAERYITPELKEYEEKVLTADEKAKALEYDLFIDLRDFVHASSRRIQKTAEVIAHLDVLSALADLARSRGYCRPEVTEAPMLDIVEGRHPVLDALIQDGSFVPNDTKTDADGAIVLITGPNMAGKSTYIRQVALLTLMSQMGSFVPAKKAAIGVADRIFARVGASDELSRGQSTFMVEMTETARILNTATPQSLVILDEIGRGTSTYDGISLAWAIVEHLHDHIGCRTFFATHYHELTDLAGSLEKVKNLNVAVQEWEDNVVFLHKIVEGAADKSYGIHVARLAGVPKQVNERAKQILAQLESEHLDEQERPKAARGKKRRGGDLQLTLFGPAEHPLLDQIRELDFNAITPMEALAMIKSWQEDLRRS